MRNINYASNLEITKLQEAEQWILKLKNHLINMNSYAKFDRV